MPPINKRNAAACMLLTIITGGLYGIYWQYLMLKNIRIVTKKNDSCAGELLCLLIIPFFSVYWWYTRGRAVKDQFAELGYTAKGSEMAYMVLSIFGLGFVALAIMQDDFNALPYEEELTLLQKVEFIRKRLVTLKRAPKIIPIVFMFVTFLYYALNLTTISNTTATANTSGMGLSEFCIMLFSLLSMVCILNAFPYRKKPVVLMIVLLAVMMAVIVFCDVYYINAIGRSTAEARRAQVILDEAGEVIDTVSAKNEYILDAAILLRVHIVLECISAFLVATLPLYSKLIRKIKTSVEVEDNGSMDAIEIEE